MAYARSDKDDAHMRANSKQPRSDEEKRKASEQVLYEYEMMCAATLARQATHGSWLGNAYVESASIHVRNLYYFFFKCGQENVVVEEFFPPPPSWEELRPEFFRDGKNLKKLHRFLAHLSWDRITTEKPEWPLLEICRQLSMPLKALGESAPSEFLCERFKAVASKIRTVMRNGDSE